MATIFYLSQTEPADVSPTKDSGWVQFASSEYREMSITKDGSAMTSETGVGDVTLHRIYVSPPLAASASFTTAGTWGLQIRAQSDGSGTELCILAKVVVGDTSTVRGHIATFAANTSTALSTTALTNRTVADTCENNFTAQIGDRVVLEIGHVSGSSRTVTLSYGSSSATDLPVNNTATAADNPTFTLSNNLTFSGGGGSATTLASKFYLTTTGVG